jgi:hypothetical protein
MYIALKWTAAIVPPAPEPSSSISINSTSAIKFKSLGIISLPTYFVMYIRAKKESLAHYLAARECTANRAEEERENAISLKKYWQRRTGSACIICIS